MYHPCRIIAGLVLLFAAATAWGDWPVFRGNPAQTGVAPPQPSPLPAKLEVLWRFKADDAFESAVAVVDGVVYAASMDEHLYAVDLKDGKQKWKFKAAPFKAAPAVRDGCVYIGDLDGFFHCVDAKKGTAKWKFDANGEVGAANFQGELILFASHDENLYCLTKDGKAKWKFKTDGPIYGSPAVADGRTFLVGCDSQLHVIDIATGKKERSVDLGGQTGATAAVVGGQLYVGTMRNEVKAIDWKKGDTDWTYKPGRSANAFFSSPAVTDRLVVIGCRDKQVHAVDRRTGKKAWVTPTGERVDSSPIVVGGRILVGSLDSNFYVLDLARGTVVQKLQLDGPISGSPVVVDGKVVIGTQKGTLYCLGEK